jgi:hypothetical protein
MYEARASEGRGGTDHVTSAHQRSERLNDDKVRRGGAERGAADLAPAVNAGSRPERAVRLHAKHDGRRDAALGRQRRK